MQCGVNLVAMLKVLAKKNFGQEVVTQMEVLRHNRAHEFLNKIIDLRYRRKHNREIMRNQKKKANS